MGLAYGYGPIMRSRNVGKDQTRGVYTTEEWWGTQSQIEVLKSISDPQASWATNDSAAPAIRFDYQYPDDLDVQTIWEVDGNDESISVYELPRIVALESTNIQMMREYFKGPESAAEPTWVGSGEMLTDAHQLWTELQKDQTHSFRAQYVLRKRQIGTNQGFPSAFMSLTNVGLVFSSAQLLPGGQWDYQMPLAIQDFIREIPDRAETNYTWGWLFKTPKIIGLPGGKFELKEEFYLELWSNLRYDAAGAPV